MFFMLPKEVERHDCPTQDSWGRGTEQTSASVRGAAVTCRPTRALGRHSYRSRLKNSPAKVWAAFCSVFFAAVAKLLANRLG